MTPAEMWLRNVPSDVGAETENKLAITDGLKFGIGLATGFAVVGIAATFLRDLFMMKGKK